MTNPSGKCCCMQERQIGWLLKEYGNAQYIPMNDLLAHLQQEIQVSSPSLLYTHIAVSCLVRYFSIMMSVAAAMHSCILCYKACILELDSLSVLCSMWMHWTPSRHRSLAFLLALQQAMRLLPVIFPWETKRSTSTRGTHSRSN